jgi:protein-L-isoaspartate(D-aspartate) O-methyltransferase
MAGARDLAPFDRIMVTAAAEDIPHALVTQLADEGKMVLPVGPQHDAQYLVKLTKHPGGGLTREDLIAVRFVPLLPGPAREL